MTNKELLRKVEYEGWEAVLMNVLPSKLDDDSLAEALIDAQEAFRVLVSLVTGEELEIVYDEEYSELNFG